MHAELDSPSSAADPASKAALAVQTDALLMAACVGCSRSFEAFYRLTSRRTFGQLLRLTGDRGEAEDLLQDVYVKVWRQGHLFDVAKGSAMQWLSTVARHCAIDRIRQRAVRPERQQMHAGDAGDDDCYAGLACGGASPLDTLITRRRADALRLELDALPDDQRESVCLAFFGGLSYSEVANQLQRPLGTVKSWVRRALLTLRSGLPQGL